MTFDVLMASPADNELSAPATNTSAIATVTGRPGFRVLVVGLVVSASGAIASPVLFTVIDDVEGLMEQFYIPAGAITPVALNYGTHPLRSSPGGSVTATLPALGASISGAVSLRYVFDRS